MIDMAVFDSGRQWLASSLPSSYQGHGDSDDDSEHNEEQNTAHDSDYNMLGSLIVHNNFVRSYNR